MRDRHIIAVYLAISFLILIALFVAVRTVGAAILRGEQRTRWLAAFDTMAAFFRSRDGWLVIMFIILGIALVIGIVFTVLYENPA